MQPWAGLLLFGEIFWSIDPSFLKDPCELEKSALSDESVEPQHRFLGYSPSLIA